MQKLARAAFAGIIAFPPVIAALPAVADEPPEGLRSETVVTEKTETTEIVETVRSTRADLKVVLDFASILNLPGPAKTIVIGNPSILDATINDERSLVLTGKTPGATNVIVLGEGNREILNATVNVVPGGQVTVVYQGAQRQTYNCVSACTPVLSVGDAPQHFGAASAQIQAMQGFAAGQNAQ